jgi:enamine deaminase RidA (YjgF/YER057c/UK114 family)
VRVFWDRFQGRPGGPLGEGISVVSAAIIDKFVTPLADARESGMTKEFFSPGVLPPSAGYSQITKVNKATLIYISGQVPNDASGKLVGEGNFEAQVEQVYVNLKLAVEAAGGTMADIVKINTYLVAPVDQAAIPKLRAIRDRYVNTAKPPASTLVMVSRLVSPDWLVEVEAVAALDD